VKVKLVAGSEVDLVSPEELREVLREFVATFERQHSERVRATLQNLSDAGGNIAIDAYEVPIGMEFRLSRVLLTADGLTFGAPGVAGVSIEIRRNGKDGPLVDGAKPAVGLPWSWVAGGSPSPHFRNGETVTVRVVGGPANTNISVFVEGDLYPRRKLDRPAQGAPSS